MDLQAVDSALSQIAGRSRRPQDTADAERRFADELTGALSARRQDLDTRPPRPSAPRTRPEDDIADRRPAPRRAETDTARAERSERARDEAVSRKERRRDSAEAAREAPEPKSAPNSASDAAPEPKTAAPADAERNAVAQSVAEEAAAIDPTATPLPPPAPVPPVVQVGLTANSEASTGDAAESAAPIQMPAGDVDPDQAALPEPAADPEADLAAQSATKVAADAMAKVPPARDGESAAASAQPADPAEPTGAPQPQTPPAAAAPAEAAQAASLAPPPGEPAPAAATAASTTVAAAAALPAAKDDAPADTLSAEEIIAIDRPVRDTSRRAGDSLDPAALLAVSTAASEDAGTEIPAGQVAGNAALLRAAAVMAAGPTGAFAAAVQKAGLDDGKPAGIAEAKEISGAPFGQTGIDRRAAIDAAVRAEQAQPPRQNLPMPPVADQIAMRMAKQAQTGEGRITLQLNPEVLGAVDVDLEVRKDGTMTAVISVEKPETLEWLKRDAQHLERALQEVGVKTDSGSLSFALREQRQEGSGGFGGRNARRGPAMTEGADTVGGRRGEAMMADIAARRIARGGVDVKI
jgi:flagellar hook-length control protein FliK